MLGIKILPETLRTIAFGSISGTYMGVGTAFLNPIRLIHITNTTDVLLTFSFDGINDHQVVPASSFVLLDITANATINGQGFFIAQGTRIYVKGSPTLGSVYLSAYYGYEFN
jgi:hypothetical protein